MPKKGEFIKFNTVKSYINDVKRMRSRNKAVNKLIKKFDSTIDTVITEAVRLAKEDKRNTIMEQDITQAIEKYLIKRPLTWQETAEEIIQHNPTDLGKISKAINTYIRKTQKR